MSRRTIEKKDLDLLDQLNLINTQQNLGSKLDRLDGTIDYEIFREVLEDDLPEINQKGGRPAYDSVFMFRILFLQRIYGQLSDSAMEYAIKDRLSFQNFLNITLADRIPDQNTIRNYREVWTKAGAIEKCFNLFNDMLKEKGVMVEPGKMVDASFVEVPIQRNSREENKHIKETGTVPESWEGKDNKMPQKDLDASWTKKNNVSYYGYKVHAIVGALSKLITGYDVTAANVHDSQVFIDLLSEEDQKVYADSAYKSEFISKKLKEMGIEEFICFKAYKNKPLTDEQKVLNKIISKTRCRVEHVFGYMTNNMKAMYVRCIGLVRVKAVIGFNNLCYNIMRFEQIKRLKILS